MPACAGLTVAPMVAALIVRAAEMAMMVRFVDADMFIDPFFWRLAAPATSIHEACQRRETAISALDGASISAPLHQGSANHANRRHWVAQRHWPARHKRWEWGLPINRPTLMTPTFAGLLQ